MTTRHKGKKESRQESADRFRLLFNYVADALFLHDLEGRLVEVNQAACESLGYTQEELLQMPVSDVEVELDCGYVGDLWDRISAGDKLTVQGLHRRKDGTTFPVELHIGPFEYDGRPHILASARDITQRHWAEEALRTSESFLYSIVDQSPYPMWISDAQGTLIKLNQACQDLLHLSPAEVVGKYNVFQDNIVEQQGLFPLLQRVFEQDETVKFELTYDTSLLETLPLETHTSVILDVTVSPITDGRGQLTNAVFQHVDITHRKRAEEALQQSERRFRALIENSPDCIVLFGEDGKVSYGSPSVTRVLGYSLPELFQATVFSVVHPDDLPGVTALFTDILKHPGETKSITSRIRHKDGSWRHLEASFTNLLDDPSVRAIVNNYRDVTERIQVEKALAESEQRFSTFMDFLPAAVFIKDQTGRLLFANRYLKDIFGWEDCLGKTTEELLPPELAARMVEDDRRALSEGNLVIQEKIINNHGEEHIFDTYKFPVVSEGAPALLGGVAVDVTARRRAVQALELSEKKYRSFYQSILDGFGRVDMTGKLVETNQGFLDMLGYTQEEIQELRYQDITPAKWHQFEADIIEQQVLTRGYSDTYEKEYIRKDGTIFPVELSTYLVEDDTGAPAGFWAFIRDITDRKQAEEALKKEKLFTEAIVDSLPGTFFIMDAQGMTLRANAAGSTITGYSFEELSQTQALEFIVDEDKPAVQQALADVFEKGETSVEAQLLTKDGRKIPFLFTAQQFIIDGQPCLLGTGVDITERKKAEEALRESEERFRRLSAATFEAIIIHDQGILLNANDQYCEMFGFALEDLIGIQVLPLTVAPEALESLRKEVASGGLGPYESVGIKKDGTKFPVEIRAREVEYAGRKVRVAAIRDITERRRAEEALRESEKKYRHLYQDFQGILDTIPDTVCLLSPDLTIMWANQVPAIREDLPNISEIGKFCYPQRHGRSEPCEDCPVLRCFKSGKMETEVRGAHGRFWELRAFPIYDDHGELRGGLEVARDITEGKRTEEALRESEERYRSLFQNQHTIMLLVDPETGAIMDANPAACTYYGFSKEELLARKVTDLNTLTPEEVFPLMQKAKAEMRTRFEFQHRLASGEIRDVEIYTGPIRINGEELLYSIIHDVTARKQTEEALRESERILKEAQEMAHLGFWHWNVKTGEVTWSDEVYKIFQLDPQEFTPHIDSILELSPWPGERERGQELIRKAMESHEKGDFEQRVLRPDKSIGYYYSTFQGKYDAAGNLNAIVGTVLDTTERKKAEEALRESEKKYRHLYHEFQGILNAIPDVLCLLSPDLKLVWSNEATVVAMQKKSAAELMGKHCYEVRFGASEPCESCPILKCFRSGKMETEESINSGVNWELRAVPLYDDQGELLGAVEVARNITERKQMEEALRESQALYHDLVETAQDLIWQCDAEGRYTYLNPAWEEVFGYKIEEMLGKCFVDFQPPEYAARDKQEFIRLLEGNNVKGLESVHLAKDGRELHLVFNAKFVQDQHGNITGTRGTAYNITERKLAEEALRRSEARFRQVVESSPLPMGLCTSSGQIEYVNPKFVETFGYTLKDIPHLNDWFRLAYPDPAYRQSIISLWHESVDKITFQEGIPEEAEVEIACKDGSKRIMQVFGSLMGDSILTVFNDLTERKRMEEALEKRLVALSRPLDDAEGIDFDDLFNLNDIQQIQDLFAEITGVASLITTPDGTPLTQPSNFCRLCRDIVRQTELGVKRCRKSDSIIGRYNPDGPNIRHCLSAGLSNAGASITVGGKHIANWLVGQVRDELHSEKAMRDYARTIKVDEEEFIAAFREIPLMPKDRFQQVAQALFVFANQLSNLAYHNVQQARFITERKRMEEALRENEKKYRSLYLEFQGILNTIPDILCLLSPDLRIVWGNEATAQALPDAQLSDIIGQHCYPLRHERSEPCESCPVLRCFDTGKMETEEVISFGDIYELRAFPLYDDQGELRGAIEVARNITERKQAEAQLLATQERLELALQGGDLGTWDWDVQTGEITCNKRWVEMLGYTLAEIEPNFNFWKKLVHPDELPEVMEILHAHLEGQTPVYETEHRLRHKSGEWVWVLDKGKVIERDAQGRALRACGTHLDITERKRAEEILKISEVTYREIFNTVSETIWIHDIDTWEFIDVNNNVKEMFGYSVSEAMDLTLDDISSGVPPFIQETAVEFLKKAAAGEPQVIEWHCKHKDGHLFWSEVHLKRGTIAGRDCILALERDITERKLAEEALRESEERLRLAVQAANQGLYDLNIQTLDIKVTPEYATMLGYDPAEFQETTDRWLERLHPDDREGVEATYLDYARGDIPEFAVEFRQRTKSGDWKWLLSRGKIVAWDENGQPLRLLGTQTDITERKQAEDLIRAEKSFSDAIIDSLPGVFYMFDEQGKFIRWNNNFEEVTGYSHDEMTVMRPTDFFEGEDRELIASRIKSAFAEGSGEAEASFVTKSGQRIPYYFRAVQANIGDQANLVGLGIDITTRRKAEEALRNSERRLSEIIDFLPDATFAVDLEGRVIAWNRAIEEMTGVQAEDILGKGNHEYTLPFYGIRRPELIDLVFVPDEEIEKKYVFVKKDGDMLLAEAEVYLQGGAQLVWAKARPLYDSEGNIVGAIEAIRDITERKLAEEERAQMEAQMREVQKLESLGVLAGGIAHDFNNLLMAILGNADLALLSLSPASPARPNVEEITKASQRAADLCRQMLAYSGKGRFVVGRYDLSEVVQEMTQMLEISVSKKATLRYSFGKELPPVEADATQLRQVIMNLITNASEALEDRSGYISVTTGVMDCDRPYLSGSYLDENLPEGRYIYLEVADTGCGLDEETRNRIFDPFFTTKFTGRGLGLAAVLGIVRGHQGAIKVYSEPGRGTTFKILLPAAEWRPGDRTAIETSGHQVLMSGTILLIDDDPDVRQVGSQMLERLGLKVVTADHGPQGLEVFRACGEEIDCVLLDLTMPEMSGDEVFRELRRLRGDVRVVLSSGYNEQEVTQRFVGKGLAGFIQKPYTTAKLKEVLSRVLDS